MRCHSCGTEVREGQKFCMDCGASLRGVADVTGEVPVIPRAPDTSTDATTPMAAVPLEPPSPAAAPDGAAAAHELTIVEATSPLVGLAAASAGSPTGHNDATAVLAQTTPASSLAAAPTAEIPTTALPNTAARAEGTLDRTGQLPQQQPAPASHAADARPRFRLRPLLFLALLAAGATGLAVFTTLVRVAPAPDNRTPDFAINDLGTNNTVAALIPAAVMVLGALCWCAGRRWGAGLVGGAGGSLAGWAALMLGAVEWWPIRAAAPTAEVTRDLGYWGLVAAGALGLLVLIVSLAHSGRDRRGGLDPWIAALAAVAFVIAAGGPLIPEGNASWSNNWSDASLGVDLPREFFVGRVLQLGLLLVCGVLGCLLVRRWGLGLAVGALLSSGWLLATSATGTTNSPIGPAYDNPGSLDLQPHAVTIVGFALAGFFVLVAVVLALLDSER